MKLKGKNLQLGSALESAAHVGSTPPKRWNKKKNKEVQIKNRLEYTQGFIQYRRVEVWCDFLYNTNFGRMASVSDSLPQDANS